MRIEEPDYVRWFDPTDTGEQDQHPILVNDRPVAIKWFTLCLDLHHSSGGIQTVEATVRHGRQLIRECDACVLVYSCTNRASFEHLALLWNELYVV